MNVKILEEAGYNSALYGFSLSYKDRAVKPEDWLCSSSPDICGNSDPVVHCYGCEPYDRIVRIERAAKANAPRNKGHNKFLEHIQVWVDIEGSLEFWKQMDTYRVGVSKQSESSMHTLDKRDITLEDLDLSDEELLYHTADDEGCQELLIEEVDEYLRYINKLPSRLKSKLLPQAYKQRRQLVLSYKVLRHIIAQRKGHKLPEWITFIEEIMKQVEHPELLEDLI